MSQIHVIANPTAGNGAARAAYARVQEILIDRKISFTMTETEHAGHATALARDAVEAGADTVLAVGGDGTFREVAEALYQTDAAVGLIPCGTGNDLARPLGIPLDTEKALDIALFGARRHMDAMEVNGKLCFNVAGFGFDVDVLDYVEIYKRRTANGSLAYMQGLFAAIKRMKLRRVQIVTPERSFMSDALIVACGNGTHFGGGMKVTPEADPFDGLMDVCVIHDVNKSALFTVLPKFLKGSHLKLRDKVDYFRTTELSASAEPESRLDIDGEVLPGTPVQIRMLPATLWVMTPKA